MLKGASVAAAEQAVFNVAAQHGPGDEGVLVVGHGAGDQCPARVDIGSSSEK